MEAYLAGLMAKPSRHKDGDAGFYFDSQTYPQHGPQACLNHLRNVLQSASAVQGLQGIHATELNILLQQLRGGNRPLLPQQSLRTSEI